MSRSSDAFIRPSPSEGSLGGVALKTRETMLLCEAAGYDVILVETVGVGQSEYEVASMVDFFMVLMLPKAGDELQGIKKGIMELADALVINKADGESINLATQTRRHYQSALHLLRHSSFWTPQVMTCSAIKNENIEAVWGMISDFQVDATKNGVLADKRARQAKEWMNKLLHEMLDIKLKENPSVKALLPELNRKVTDGQTTPFLAAQKLINLLFEDA